MEILLNRIALPNQAYFSTNEVLMGPESKYIQGKERQRREEP
jgi:hypothetical protein